MELLEPKSPPPKKRPNLFVRFLAFLTTLALVAGAVFLVANRDKYNLDSFRRWISYLGVERSDSGQTDSFSFEGGSANSFASVDGGLLVCSPASIQLYSAGGELVLNKTVSTMENPVIDANEHTALVYNAGGRELFAFSGNEEVFSLSLGEGESLLSARINDNGYLAVTAQTSGYKGTVTVYDSSFTPQLRISLSSRFVTDAVVSPNGDTVALVTLGLDSSTFGSQLELYRTNRSEEDVEPDYTAQVGNDVVLDLSWGADGIWLLGESTLSVYSAKAERTALYDYSGSYLKNYSLDASGCAVLLLGKYRAGSDAVLRTVDAKGEVMAEHNYSEQVLSLSAANNYIAVLTAGKLEIFTRDLDSYRSLDTTQGARRVLQRADGSTLLLNADSAHLYVPN